MRSLPNTLSFIRIPLAFVFLESNPYIRACAILLAMITDGLDGYLARKNQWTSNLGKILDPATDKFFVFFSLAILLKEHQIESWQIMAMLCRDVSVALYGLYLFMSKKLSRSRIGAIWCGKITTALQFIVMLAITLGYIVPPAFFLVFIVLGVLALFEFYFRQK